jgi:hypothetical protein
MDVDTITLTTDNAAGSYKDRQKGRDKMKPPTSFVRIVDRTSYDVQKAELLAGDDFWDGHNFERHGRNCFLYQSPGGRYFTVRLTQWQGEQDTLDPLSIDEAIQLYKGPLTEHRVDYQAAFPDVTVEGA